MVLLSFDIEEFPVAFEHGVDLSLDEKMRVSVEGTKRILDVLKKNDVKATFFCTGVFVQNAPDIIRRMIDEGHELACHGVDHCHPKNTDVRESKRILEKATGGTAMGYRQPRMFEVDDDEIEKAGYLYNSSLNPAFIPGHYMHLSTPRTCFMKGKVLQIPASVTPWIRFPLFWLALHNLPEWLYHMLVRRVLSHDGYFTTYFHPWEFYDLNKHPEWKVQWVSRRHSGQPMTDRLDRFIQMLKKHGHAFGTYTPFAIEQRNRLTGNKTSADTHD